MNNKFFFYSCVLLFCFKANALEYSKIDLEGCPENSYCKKETGLNRKKWLEELKKFVKGEISEQKINAFVQAEFGIPVSGWAREEASLLPNVLMWNSPCKQHNNPANKYYIAEVFRKNFHANELKDYPNIFFSRAVMKTGSIIVPRGDAPLFIKDGSLFYLREEEGNYYGLMIDPAGNFRITKTEKAPNPSKEAICEKDMITTLVREAPGANFYQGEFCKELWDTQSKSYKTVLFGWSCN